MKRIIVAIAGISLFAACNNKPAPAGTEVSSATMDVVSVTDGGVTYKDTIEMHSSTKGGVIVATDDTTTVENSTGRFLHPASKKNYNYGDSFYYQCNIRKTTNGSIFTLIYQHPGVSNVPISFAIVNAVGPQSGVGVYKAGHDNLQGADSSAAKFNTWHSFVTGIADQQKYTVDDVTVNITKEAGDKIEGTFEIKVTGTGGSKSITGTINSGMVVDKPYAAK